MVNRSRVFVSAEAEGARASLESTSLQQNSGFQQSFFFFVFVMTTKKNQFFSVLFVLKK